MKNVKVETRKTGMQVTFCGSKSCCPSVLIDENNPDIIVGGKEEGFTRFTKEQFRLFVKTVKEGMFDKI